MSKTRDSRWVRLGVALLFTLCLGANLWAGVPALDRPGLTVFNNYLFVFFQGVDDGIYYKATPDGVLFSTLLQINPDTDRTPPGRPP